jgi:glutamate formiminotransferase/formiminotetrahydrofolate cyclodeaminase
MVANLSSHKKGWDERWEEFSNWAEKGQQFKDDLLRLVDADTKAFNGHHECNEFTKRNR